MPSKIKAALRLLFCFQAIFCLKAKAAEFDLSDSLIYLDHFTANGIYQPETNQEQILHWAISGERAALQGSQCNLSGFELSVHNQNEGTYTLQSAQCEFSRANFEFRSPAAVLLQGRGIRISGIGYDVYGKDQDLMLVIRSTVQINFQRQRFAEGQKSAAPFRHKNRPKTPQTANKP